MLEGTETAASKAVASDRREAVYLFQMNIASKMFPENLSKESRRCLQCGIKEIDIKYNKNIFNSLAV